MGAQQDRGPIRSSRYASAAPTLAAGLLVAILPKCPICLAAYLGVLSGFGIELSAPAALWPLAWAMFGVALFFLAFRAIRKRRFGPIALSLAGATLMVLGRVVTGSSALLWLGFAVFAAGPVWSAALPSRGACAPACATTEAAG